MDDRIRDRRRSVNRQRGRRRAGLILVAVAVIAAAGLFLWLRSSDVFAVHRVTATATQHATQQQIADLTSDALGASLLSLSVGEIKERLRGLPYVRSVEVYRRFPNTLDIRLVEYEPTSRLQVDDGGVWLIADDGRVLDKVHPPRGAGLPLLVFEGSVTPGVGEMVPEAVARALPVTVLLEDEEFAEGLPAVDRTRVSAGGAVVVVLKDGAELRLGDPTELEYKLMVASNIIQRYLRDDKQVAYVDLTVPERVAVRAE